MDWFSLIQDLNSKNAMGPGGPGGGANIPAGTALGNATPPHGPDLSNIGQALGMSTSQRTLPWPSVSDVANTSANNLEGNNPYHTIEGKSALMESAASPIMEIIRKAAMRRMGTGG